MEFDPRKQKRMVNCQAIFKDKAPINLDPNTSIQFACNLFLDNYVLELGTNLHEWTSNATQNMFFASQNCNLNYHAGFSIEKLPFAYLKPLFIGPVKQMFGHLSNILLLLNNIKNSYCIVGYVFCQRSYIEESAKIGGMNTAEKRANLITMFGRFAAWYSSLLNGACRPTYDQLKKIHDYLNKNETLKARYNAILDHFPKPNKPESPFEWAKLEDLPWWQQDYCQEVFEFKANKSGLQIDTQTQEQFYGLLKKQNREKDLDVLVEEQKGMLGLFGVKTKQRMKKERQNRDEAFILDQGQSLSESKTNTPKHNKRMYSLDHQNLEDSEQPHPTSNSTPHSIKSALSSVPGSPMFHSTPKRPKVFRNIVNQPPRFINFFCLSSGSEQDDEGKQLDKTIDVVKAKMEEIVEQVEEQENGNCERDKTCG